jgi:hypothetical protein
MCEHPAVWKGERMAKSRKAFFVAPNWCKRAIRKTRMSRGRTVTNKRK